jgi:hypothetical protein
MKRKKKDKRPRRLQIYTHQRKRGKTVICVEMGFVDRTRNFSVSLWDIVGYGDYSMNLPSALVPRRAPLPPGTDPAPDPEGHVLFCQQRPKDAQIRGINYMVWCADTVRNLLERGGRVVFRRHPKLAEKEHARTDAMLASLPGAEESKNALLEEDLRGCSRVVAYNSNSLLEAAMRRVPIVCLGSGSVVSSLATTALDEPPRRPSNVELNEALARVTWYQWSVADIRKGLPFEFTLKTHNPGSPSPP